jgi:hypothetical protein
LTANIHGCKIINKDTITELHLVWDTENYPSSHGWPSTASSQESRQ